METTKLLIKVKEHILNILIIVLAVMISFNNYKVRSKALETLRAKRDVEVKINEILDEIDNLQKKNSALKNKINTKTVASTMDALGNMSRDANVKITLIKPQVEKPYAAYTLYPFEVSITANSYHRVAKFINLLEKTADIYLIDNMELGINTQTGGDKITVKLFISTILINK